MCFYVYILRSTDDELYIGQTNNLVVREKQHQRKGSKAAKFIRDGKIFHLVFYEKFATRIEAMRREKQLKGWTRKKKESLISGDIDLLKQLSKSTYPKHIVP